MHKKCRICEKIKSIDNFHKKKSTKDGHRNECKECVKDIQKKYKEVSGFKDKQKEYDKKRYEENREEILKRKKEYHTENRDSILSYKKVYREDNKDKIKEYLDIYREEHKEEAKEWRKNNRQKLANNQETYRRDNPHIVAWRSLLYSTLKRLDTPKQGHTVDMLGYSALELKQHIESKFTTGMTWDNHGEWHIDHIKGVINFDKDTDVGVVCALDNLQPLWSTTREIDGVVYEGNLNKNKFD